MPATPIVWKAKDTQPLLADRLSLSDGTVPPLTGATIKLVMRSLANATATTLAGTVTVVNPNDGDVTFLPTAADTNQPPGHYLLNWVVTSNALGQMTFPTEGYLWAKIEPNLTDAPQQIVSMPDAKRYLGIAADDFTRDADLIDLVSEITPLIEMEVGPIVPRNFEEWHDGGSNLIQLRRLPSSGYGTSPVLTLVAVSEFRGGTEFPLSLIASPAFGAIYSVFLDPEMGTLTRRSAGGGTLDFVPGRGQIHVVYQSGQAVTPPNVRRAALEAIRVNWQTVQQVGRGRRTVADEQDAGPALGYFLPRRCYELLRPSRHAPSFA